MRPRSGTPWLLRICLVFAIVSCVTTGVLNLIRVKHKIDTLQSNLASQTAARESAEKQLTTVRGDLATTSAQLKETRTALEVANEQQQQAQATAVAQTRRADQLHRELSQLTREHADTSARLARFEATGLDAEQVLYAARELKHLRTQLAEAKERSGVLETKLKRALDNRPENQGPVILPAGLKAKVIAADPKWHFIVLDAGEKAGVLERGELLLSRNGQLLARARVCQVEGDRCIANLLPGWELNEILEGDVAIAAPPHS